MMMMVMMVMMGGDSDEETTKNEQGSRISQTVGEGGSCGALTLSKNKWRWPQIEKQEMGTDEQIQSQGEHRGGLAATSTYTHRTKAEIKARYCKPGFVDRQLGGDVVSTYVPTSIASPAPVSVAVTTTAGS